MDEQTKRIKALSVKHGIKQELLQTVVDFGYPLEVLEKKEKGEINLFASKIIGDTSPTVLKDTLKSRQERVQKASKEFTGIAVDMLKDHVQPIMNKASDLMICYDSNKDLFGDSKSTTAMSKLIKIGDTVKSVTCTISITPISEKQKKEMEKGTGRPIEVKKSEEKKVANSK